MKNLIVAIIILTFSFSYSQTNKKRFISNSIDSFKTGEWLQFRVHYGFFNASEIEIKLEKKKIDSVTVFHAKGYGRSTGLLRFFLKLKTITNHILENQMAYRYGLLEIFTKVGIPKI